MVHSLMKMIDKRNFLRSVLFLRFLVEGLWREFENIIDVER